VTAESANLNADGTVECHFSLEEFSAPALTRTIKRTSWCRDVHLFQLISRRIWQARQMEISLELSAEYLVHSKACHKHGSLSGSDESTFSENCSIPWPLTGTKRHTDLLSPRFLHIPNILPSDFSPPKFPPTPKNNQTLAVPSASSHFRICVFFLKLRGFFLPLLHSGLSFTYWLAVGKVPNFPAFPTLRPEEMFSSEMYVNLYRCTRLPVPERR